MSVHARGQEPLGFWIVDTNLDIKWSFDVTFCCLFNLRLLKQNFKDTSLAWHKLHDVVLSVVDHVDVRNVELATFE